MRKFTTGQRLKELMHTQGLRQIDILNKTAPHQKRLGISLAKSHLSNYVNDRSAPDAEKMKLLALALDVSEPWLMGYEDETDAELEAIKEAEKSEENLLKAYRKLTQPRKEKAYDFVFMQLDQQTEIFKAPHTRTKKERSAVAKVKIFEKKDGTLIYPNVIGAAAGAGTSHYADLDFDEIMIPTDEAYTQTHIVPLYVRGDSMQPKYFDGDVLWVDTKDKSLDRAQIGVFDTASGRVVKQMGTGVLISLNPEYPDIKLSPYMDFSTYGKVVDVIRGEQLQEWLKAKWV